MEKSVKDNPEYKMKRQGMIIGLVCLAVMVFLTIFLMSRYRQRTEKIFTELMEESLLSTHSEALTEMENFLAGSTGADKVEEAWEALNEDEGNVLHYVCNSDGKILAGDMRIFDIEYTVATVLHSQPAPSPAARSAPPDLLHQNIWQSTQCHKLPHAHSNPSGCCAARSPPARGMQNYSYFLEFCQRLTSRCCTPGS